MKQKRQISTRVFVTVIVLTMLFCVAFLQRILPITGWKAFPDNYIVDGEAILTNVDGYYYLNTAKEVLEGTYSTEETHRAIPDTISRSPIPPLLSVLTAGIAKISGISINWVGATLPAVLSLFIAAPIFFLGWRYGGAIAATVATSITLLAPAFLTRNNFGFYDTDCMNAFFPYSCAVLFLLFAVKAGRQRYLFLLAGSVTALLFLWWWDQTSTVPLVLGGFPLCMALLFFYRPTRKEGVLFAIIAIIVCIAVVAVVGIAPFTAIPESILRMFFHISKQSSSLYPAVSASIGEQSAMEWKDFSKQTFAYSAIFPFALTGIALFIFRARKEITLLLPILLVAAFTFFFASRFVIFTVPMFSLGLGILLAEIYKIAEKTRNSWVSWGYILCVISFLAAIFWKNFQNTPDLPPVFTAPSLAGMKSLQKLEKNALIWSWWDQGHPIIYWGEKDTINDGMVHDNERTHCNAVPLVAKNDRFAANYINFYSTRGKAGKKEFLQLTKKDTIAGEDMLRKLLTAGPNQTAKLYPHLAGNVIKKIEQLLFPKQNRPIYLFLDIRQTNSNWINFFGTWDMKERNGKKLLPSAIISLSQHIRKQLLREEMPKGKSFCLDKNPLQLHLSLFSEQPLPLSEMVVTTEDGAATTLAENTKERKYSLKKRLFSPEKRESRKLFTATGQYVFDINLPANIMLLRDKKMADSLSNRLFWRYGEYDPRYFSPVELQQPYYQIWRVKSDMYNRMNQKENKP